MTRLCCCVPRWSEAAARHAFAWKYWVDSGGFWWCNLRYMIYIRVQKLNELFYCSLILFDRLVQYHPAATGSHSPVRRLVTGTWEHQVSYGWSKLVEHVWTVACLCFQTCLLSILFCWPQLSIPLRSLNTCSSARQVESPLLLCLAVRLILAACCQIFGWASKIHEFEEGDPKADLI